MSEINEHVKKSSYQFYMQECGKDWKPIEGTQKNLEDDFDGLRYLKAEGLLTIGKTRVYTEKYAEQNGTRLYIPENPTHDSTNITLSLCFFGNNRHTAYHSFLAFCVGKRLCYWDNARNVRVYVYVENEVKPAKEMWYGSIPYLSLDLHMVNINGTYETIE